MARNRPPKLQILTFFPRKKTLSPSQKGGEGVSAVCFNCWGLGGGTKGQSWRLGLKNEKGGQKLAAKISTAHLFPRKKTLSPSQKGGKGVKVLYFNCWGGEGGGTMVQNWRLGLY